MIEPGIYRHYKGKYYAVLGLVRHSETEEIMVLYVPLYLVKQDTVPTQMCVRPLDNFMNITYEGEKRFTRCLNLNVEWNAEHKNSLEEDNK